MRICSGPASENSTRAQGDGGFIIVIGGDHQAPLFWVGVNLVVQANQRPSFRTVFLVVQANQHPSLVVVQTETIPTHPIPGLM